MSMHITERVLFNAESELVRPVFIEETHVILVEDDYLAVMRLDKLCVVDLISCDGKPEQVLLHEFGNVSYVIAMVSGGIRVFSLDMHTKQLQTCASFKTVLAVSFCAIQDFVFCLEEDEITVYGLISSEKAAVLSGFQPQAHDTSDVAKCACNAVISQLNEALEALEANEADDGCGKGSSKAGFAYKHRFLSSKLEKLQKEEYFCDNCLEYCESIVHKNLVPAPSFSPLQVIATRHALQYGHQWAFDRMAVFFDGAAYLALFGTMPQIVIYEIDLKELRRGYQGNSLQITPIATVQGMVPAYKLAASIMSEQEFVATANLSICQCDAFADDVNDLRFISADDSSVILSIYSQTVGLSTLRIEIAPEALTSPAGKINDVMAYETENETNASTRIIERCFLGQMATENAKWRKQFDMCGQLSYIMYQNNEVIVTHNNVIIREIQINETTELYGITAFSGAFYCWNQSKMIKVEEIPT